MRFLDSDHFFRADKNVEIYAFFTEQNGERLVYATLKDDEQIFFETLESLIRYDVLGEDVTRIYCGHEDVERLLDSEIEIKDFNHLSKQEGFELVKEN